jgi:hypothetical protein
MVIKVKKKLLCMENEIKNLLSLQRITKDRFLKRWMPHRLLYILNFFKKRNECIKTKIKYYV